MPPQPFFQVPTVEDNEDGWGPTTVPQQLEGIPYAPFSKGEKVSKISDFTGSGFNRFGGQLHLVCLPAPQVLITSSGDACEYRSRPRSGPRCCCFQLLSQRGGKCAWRILAAQQIAVCGNTGTCCFCPKLAPACLYRRTHFI